MAASDMTAEQKIALIKDQLQEVLHEDIIQDVIVKQNRPLKIYWGTATTGRPHCGYFVPMVKIAHFLRAGCHVKILLADVHGFLDNLKAPIELVKFRATYYRFVIESMLRAISVPIDKLEFVLGSDYQHSKEYSFDLLKMSTVVSENNAKRAGAEVVKQSDDAPLSGLIYPLMQALDEEYLGVDAQFGGVDQRKIFILAAEQLPKLGMKPRAHLMNPMVPGLAGGKMSSSDPDSKIDILETAEGVKKKIKKAFAVPKDIEGNGMISFVEYVLLPVSALQHGGKGQFVMERREGEGEPLVYHDIESIKADYVADKITPQLLKAGVTATLNKLLEPIQAEYLKNQDWQDIDKKAYPPPPEAAKKQKKVKDRGSRFPVAQVEAKPDGHVEGPDADKVNLGTTAAEAMKKLDVKDA